MSIQQEQNFNGQRMVARTFDSIDGIIDRLQQTAADRHASVVLEDRFWTDVQNAISRHVSKKRQLLAAGGYTDAAQELRTLEALAIRTAVEDFRARTKDDPHCIHDDAAWEQFRADIRAYADELSF